MSLWHGETRSGLTFKFTNFIFYSKKIKILKKFKKIKKSKKIQKIKNIRITRPTEPYVGDPTNNIDLECPNNFMTNIRLK